MGLEHQQHPVIHAQSPGPLIFRKHWSREIQVLQYKLKKVAYPEPVLKNFEVLKRPDIGFSFSDVCKDDPVIFNATNSNPAVSIRDWNWNFGDGGQMKAGNSVNHKYKSGGKYLASLYATSTQGCNSFKLSDTVQVYETKAYAGNDTILATGQSYQLKGSGGELYSWSPLPE